MRNRSVLVLSAGVARRALFGRVAAALTHLAIAIFVAGAVCVPARAQSYKVTNIISDGSVPAMTVDAHFINPWAVSTSGTWWISAEDQGYNYVVPGSGPAFGTILFKVIVPDATAPAGTPGSPAGSVTTAGTVGMVLPNGAKASFLFSTIDGTISGWNSRLGIPPQPSIVAQIVINNKSKGASYPGMAILNIASAGVTTASYILVANFAGNAVEVYDSNFRPTKLGNNFADPSLPPGYAPSSIHVLGTRVFVAYALHGADPEYGVVGSGNGVVNVFDNGGNFVARVVTFGNLNAPWGVAIAPANFGVFSNALLIGNFGDGKINAYDPKTYNYLGQLMDATGKPLSYAFLWELLPGQTTVTGTTGMSGGDPSTVYFTAGLKDGEHGLFAGIANGTTAGAAPTFGFSTSAGAATVPMGGSTTATVSVAPVNGFSGNVTLACSGLPAKATCNFSPSSLAVSSTSVATGSVTIQTGMTTKTERRSLGRTGVAFALLIPVSSVLIFRGRRQGSRRMDALRMLGLMIAFVAVSGLFAGCSDKKKVTPGTPPGTTTVTMTATAGSVTQQTTFGLTVQ
jgi:uncharacterized protein (TIGR03118 family)